MLTHGGQADCVGLQDTKAGCQAAAAGIKATKLLACQPTMDLTTHTLQRFASLLVVL